MATWEQVLLGVGALILVFLFWPGVKATMERSRAVENPDWKPEGKPEGDCERKKCAGPACNSPKCGM